MVDELCLAQLPHPYKEPFIRNKVTDVPWNTGSHKRKFVKSDGEYVTGSALKKDSLMFWCEWEPQSKIIKRFSNVYGDYPKYLQKPIWPCVPPSASNSLTVCGGCGYQNTDPYIFDANGFIYSNCRQMKAGLETQMAHLQIGSLILFGSVLSDANGQRYFGIDTVFVVKDYEKYSQQNYINVRTFINNRDFFVITPLDKLNLGKATLRCYRGATFSNRENDMYSFVPCKVCNDPKQGFERLKLTMADLKMIEKKVGCKNLLFFNPRVHHTKQLSHQQIKIVWNEIRRLVKGQGLLEGVQFYL